MITNYFIGLILTLAIEILIARLFFYEKFITTAVIMINLISHPLFNFSLFILKFNFEWQISWSQILVFEIIIFLIEALLLYFANFDKTKAFKLSFFANSASFLIGYILVKLKFIFLYL